MTREFLLLLLGFVLAAGLVAVVMQVYLLWMAFRARRITVPMPLDAPERLVADDVMLDTSGGIVLAIVTAGLGFVFLLLVLNGPGPPNPDGTYEISQAGLALLILLFVLGVVEVLQGARGVVSLQRITRAIEDLRTPPEACRQTTFEGCPFISPERLLEIRATALKLAEEVTELTEHPHGAIS